MRILRYNILTDKQLAKLSGSVYVKQENANPTPGTDLCTLDGETWFKRYDSYKAFLMSSLKKEKKNV